MEESGIVPLSLKRDERKGKGRKRVKIAVFFLLMSLLIAGFYVQYCKAVVVIEGSEEKQFFTFTSTVGDFLQEKGLETGRYDEVIPGKEEKINSGDTILIKRAIPVTLAVDGYTREVWTHSSTVADLLEENSLYLTGEETISPHLNSPLNPGDEVSVNRVKKARIIEREAIPFNTVRVNNPNLDRGIVRVIAEGSEGIREHVIELVEKNGEEISRTVLSSEVVKAPENRVLEYGDNSFFSRGDRVYEFKTALYVNATAYCPGTPGSGCPVNDRGASHCTGYYNDGYTFTGVKAVAGDGSLSNPHIIAVDPDVIPLKSLVYLEGYGFARAEDTGSAIKNNSIDLLFDQHHDAYMFGRKQLKVYILADFEQ